MSEINGCNANPPLIQSSFPPGPPSDPFYYIIPDTDLAIHFAPLGLIPGRNETLVTNVLREAFYTSLDYRVTAKMPGHGYQLQEREFLLSVSHSAGMHDLTWGMWTIILTAMTGYVHAYAGYDFMYEIECIPEGQIRGHMIGAGFAMTRGR